MAHVDRGSLRLETGPAAPTGREARLWRVLVELSVQVEEARAAFARDGKPRALLPGRLENVVVEFDDAYTVYVEGMERLPDEAQLLALQAVDRQLAGMVGAKEAALWTEQALREDRRWNEAERLARAAIRAHAWPERRLSLVASEALVGELVESISNAAKRGGHGPGGTS
ncbi:MAG: hypothetical protein IPK00_11110 [Deltaproteobacteria bacterium]|nr:hypothetical protein [Deltaproteobacteria bacterium]